ncbi:MAG TPA: response regulator transcription factor [Bacteroidales bacterium]|jgi:DNA-binding NarL/FixJ family response regulator|nr:response regulator transcription factor [Bacteroidales bacterium]MDI9533753.1 response regulator transcription factor [Bacteroidota bacterium]OPZ57160.1 MAG: Transcriptional regulatory protein DegU [Bacteroidetes bacterium ADurb.BinA012]MBK7732262.1 response regulator transcription factor [Bacteroidales bacterium]MBP7036123.1 response regulator transcription factor [Bacteroidales bacterium]
MEKIRIALADDHQLFRNGLKILLGGYPEFEVVAEASNGTELLKVLENCPTDIVLMDINMPEMDGVEATSRISRQIPEVFVIALSMYGEEEYYYRMVEAGAKGFILKDSDISDVHDAIIAVHRGGNYFSQELLYHVIRRIKNREQEEKSSNLSRREKEILFKICEGLSNHEIAEELFISKRTVDKHRANLLAKTGSKNTASLILYAIKNRLIEV